MRTQNFAGVLMMVLAALGFSFKSIFIKLAYQHGVDTLVLLRLRMVLAVPFFIAALLVYRWRQSRSTGSALQATEIQQMPVKLWRQSAAVGGRFLYLLVLSLAGVGGSAWLSFYSISMMDASLSTLIVFTYPAMVVFYKGIRSRSFAGRQILALVLAFAGLMLILRLDRHWNPAPGTSVIIPAAGALAALGAALAFAFYNIGSEALMQSGSGKALSPLELAAYSVILTAATLLFSSGGATDWPLDPAVWGYALLLATVSGFIPFTLFMYGIRRIGAGPGTIINMIGPAFNSLWAWLLLGESRDPLQISGILLIFLGIAGLKLNPRLVSSWLIRRIWLPFWRPLRRLLAAAGIF
ncbi:MAG: DMT family transporter [Leptospiraceae bacterium]|nr:DMT family transporter [Leptospiraceae bacterium]